MAKDPIFTCLANGAKQGEGSKEKMLRLARVLGRGANSGIVSVYQLTPGGNIFGQPIWKSENGKIKVK